MKEKFKLYTIVSLCFVAFSLVLFVFYFSETLENHESVNAAVVDKYFIDSYQSQAPDTPPPVQKSTPAKDTLKKDTSKSTVIEQKDKTPEKAPVKEEEKEVTVYICNSESAYAYHATSYCKGLSRCKAETKNVTKTQAENWGRRPCKVCY